MPSPREALGDSDELPDAQQDGPEWLTVEARGNAGLPGSLLQDGLRNIAVLRALGARDWTHRDEQEGVGAIALCDIPAMMAEHDASHRQEIEEWKRARS